MFFLLVLWWFVCCGLFRLFVGLFGHVWVVCLCLWCGVICCCCGGLLFGMSLWFGFDFYGGCACVCVYVCVCVCVCVFCEWCVVWFWFVLV